MAGKSIRFFRGHCVDGQVRLLIEKGAALYKRSEPVLNFRIYRKRESAFVQGTDYGEYFDGLDVKDAVLIHEGPLEQQQRYCFVFTDTDVQPREVYSYWAAHEDDAIPVGPVGIAVRDPEVWWTFERINREMDRVCDLYAGDKQVKRFGYSTRKKELNGMLLGNPRSCIGLLGVIHAGESGPELFLKAAEDIIRNHPDLLAKTGLAILPAVNADCREDMATGTPQYLRCNPNGVDLNRNFDVDWDTVDYTYGLNTAVHGSLTYRGPFPHSEDETRAAACFLETVKPAVVFCGHWLASLCSDCFLTAKEAEGDAAFREACLRFITPYTEGFRDVAKEGVSLHFGCVAGSLSAYAYRKYGIPAFDMEFRRVKDADQEQECACGKTKLASLEEFRNYHAAGILKVMRRLAG